MSQYLDFFPELYLSQMLSYHKIQSMESLFIQLSVDV